MLKSIDILIGLSVVMLVISMAVTLVTQAMLTVVASRGKHLLAGLIDLLQQLDRSFMPDHAEEIAKLILGNPLINGGKFLGFVRFGEVIHREELTKLLLDLSGHVDPTATMTGNQQAALAKLKEVIAANGIQNPEQTLDNVRMIALQLEKLNPDVACDVRQNIALLQGASSQFLAKINLRFDAVMDRVSERYTFSARLCTFVSAIVVAVALQLDTVDLVNRFAMDDGMRTAFVQEAIKSFKEQPNGTPNLAKAESETAKRDQYFAFLTAQGVITPPATYEMWKSNWHNVNIPGLMVSILLLSLGAPFWYSTLNRLLQLRSSLTQKDDQQRLTRQETQVAENIHGSAALAQMVGSPPTVGERGDLNAIG